MRRNRTLLVLGISLCWAVLGCGRGEPVQNLLLATTTSVRDSGLLEELLPLFSEQTGIHVQVIAVGSGAALRMGREGNADLLLTHAPAGEELLVASGAALSRRPFMENHFVIAGPPEDPAGVADAASAVDALRRIERAGAPYVSRGDDSGTHRREAALFKAAGIAPQGGWAGFVRTGAGMGLSLEVAGERRAYVLSDLGSFLAFRERTELVALSRPEPGLRNVYALLRINPDRFSGRIHADGAKALEAFLVEEKVQRRIGEFGRERFGLPLFHPLEPRSPENDDGD